MDYQSFNIGTLNINTISNQNKINALHNFTRTHDLDILFLQEVYSDELFIPGYTVICNVDHNRRGTAVALKHHIKYTNVEKSVDSRVIALRLQGSVTLVNVYAPSGSQQRTHRETFFNTTLAHFLRHQTNYTILAGDFNSVINARDATGEGNHSLALKNTVQQTRLKDVWEALHGTRVEHTYITHNSASRIDRVYVSSNLRDQLRTAYVSACSFTNHMSLTTRLCLPNQGRAHGMGFWSLRPYVLTDETIEEFQQKWNYWTRQRRSYNSWMQWWLRLAKPKMKSFFRWKSKEAFDDFTRKQQHLYAQLHQAYRAYLHNPDMLTSINRIKSQLLLLQKQFTQLFVRINDTHVAGEPLSTFQLGERTRKRTIIESMENDAGASLESSDEIQEHVVNYYRNLYAEGETRANPEFDCARVVPPDSISNHACMEEITTAEIYEAIKFSSSKKSPGSDGLPKEFYVRTFDIIHRELNLLLNEALRGDIPEEFVNGVIVLVKKKQAGNSITAYRPISLLNYDYKLLARILKARVDRVLREHDIISPVQKCSNGDRNIYQATLSLKDRIAQLRSQRLSGKLVSFDLSSAFDRVDRGFLYHTMNSLGLNPDLVNLLERIGERSTSRILINGHLSAAFPIQRSVRQGDPLAMHLFAIYLHPLLARMERICDGPHDLVVAYADDISMITTNADKAEQVRGLFRDFEGCSGAMLNLRKTTAIDVGHINDRNRLALPWIQSSESVKVLGVIYLNSLRQMINKNWDTLITKMGQLIWLHRMRSLTLHQKVTLLNVFITSKMWYLSSVLAPYKVHIAKITSIMGSYLWHGHQARVPMHQLALPIEGGGLKLHLPYFKCRALLTNRHLQESNSTPFYKTFMQRIQNPPDLHRIPTDCPCLKVVCQEIAYLPEQLINNATATGVHTNLLQQVATPKVMSSDPTLDWKLIWRNINSKKLKSAERSWYFLLVNKKTTHGELLHRMNIVNTPNCAHCGAQREDLQHKFSACSRVTGAWRTLQRHLAAAGMNGTTSFNSLAQPELRRLRRDVKHKVMKLFINYINFINQCNNQIDVDSLNFHLENEI